MPHILENPSEQVVGHMLKFKLFARSNKEIGGRFDLQSEYGNSNNGDAFGAVGCEWTR